MVYNSLDEINKGNPKKETFQIEPRKWKYASSMLFALIPTAFLLIGYYSFEAYRGYIAVPQKTQDTYIQVIINPDESKNRLQFSESNVSVENPNTKVEVTTPSSLTGSSTFGRNVETVWQNQTASFGILNDNTRSEVEHHKYPTKDTQSRVAIKKNENYKHKNESDTNDSTNNRTKIIEKRDSAFLKFMDEIEHHSTATHRKLPGLIGLGVEKCGTGALSCMLENHPMLRSAHVREAHFFDKDAKYFSGIRAYLYSLPRVTDYQISMEKSPSYFTLTPDIPHRIKHTVPNAKLYAVLCDPLNRTYSDFIQETWTGHFAKNSSYNEVMRTRMNLVKRKLKSELADDEISKSIFSLNKGMYTSHIITHGMYYYHLQRWYKVFSPEEILVINGDEIIKSPWKVVEKLQDFLGVPKFITKENFVKNPATGFYSARPLKVLKINGSRIVSYGKPSCYRMNNKGRTRNGNWWQNASPQITDELRNFYRPYNEKLFKLLGKRFTWQT